MDHIVILCVGEQDILVHHHYLEIPMDFQHWVEFLPCTFLSNINQIRTLLFVHFNILIMDPQPRDVHLKNVFYFIFISQCFTLEIFPSIVMDPMRDLKSIMI